MICPKCESIIDDNSEVCYNCGSEIQQDEQSVAEGNSQKRGKKEKLNLNKISKLKTFKTAGIVIAAIAVLIIIILILRAVFSVNGAKIAAELGDNVGKSINKAEKSAGVTLVAASKSGAINIQGDFDAIYEAKDMISVDGVHVPEWVIKVTKLNENVHCVYYRDYRSQEDYYKGEKLKEPIVSSDIQAGMSEAKVERLFEVEPISKSYYSDATEVCYMFYFINENKDEERRMIMVSYNDIMEVTSVKDIDMTVNENLK